MERILQFLNKSIIDRTLVKITLSRPRKKASDLRNVYVKPILLRGKYFMHFTYRFTKRDETKNYEGTATVSIIEQLLSEAFLNGVVSTLQEDANLMISKKGIPTFFIKKAVDNREIDYGHDHKKNRLIDSSNPWWHQLGLTSPEGSIISSMQHKFKQIYKYAEIVLDLIKSAGPINDDMLIADMGAGKGYLTFALYELCHNYLRINPHIEGVEIRSALVTQINDIIQENGLINFKFTAHSIDDYSPNRLDIMVALHACDTATDDAIIKGISYNARLIICAPCCHKQIRREMEKSKITNSITKYGIFMERQAVMITDTIRTLILEYFGYRTKVMEFIEIDDTPKNVLICGIWTGSLPSVERQTEILQEINELKSSYGIQSHYLERIFNT